MKDLIERQAAIDAVKKNTFRLTFAEEQNCEGHLAWSANAVYSDVIEGALLELPSAQPEITLESAIDYLHSIGWMQEHDRVLTESAQPERKTGRWIDDGDPFMWVCDVCGYRVKRYNNTRYCPHCGARMEGDDGSD